MTPVQPNLLFLVHRFPYPPNRGDRIRSFHMLQCLAKHYRVYLGTLYDEEPESQHLEVLQALCERVAVFPIGKYSRWLRAAARLARGESATEGLFESLALQRCIRQWIHYIRFEVAVAFCSSMAQYVSPSSGIPLVVDLVDVDSQKWFDYAESASLVKQALFKLEARRTRQLECSLPARCNVVTLVSEDEAKVFRSFCPNNKTFGVGNGVDLDYFRPNENRSSNTTNFQCVFVGALDYRANVLCLQWFCQHCWPTIHRKNKNATLTLVGRNPVAAVRRLEEVPGVRLVGQVPDVRPYVWQSAIAIAPLQIARGIQNKVLEAMAMGIPVVGSPQAIEGIGCCVGQDILQADTPESWITTILSLLDDSEKQNSLAVAGRTFVEHRHSWSTQLAPLLSHLQNPSNLASPISGQVSPVQSKRSSERVGATAR
jgi:polysaccharide biosynthesis protein PslH